MTFPILPSGGAVAAPLQVQRSLRFNSADGTSLDRTPSSATNRQTFTISFWAKNPSTAGAITTFYAAGSDTNNNETIIGYWDGLYVQSVLAGTSWRIRTTAVYRDPSAWYHYVFAFDLGNGTQANRLKVYVNGAESTYAAADGQPLPTTANSMVNNNVIQYIGRRAYSATGQTTNAYLAEFYLIDGQALTPSSFGETNATTGQWQPKKYTGTYGTNGFYLNFSDNSGTTATTLGKDYSGNGNNWTPNNFSVTPGAGNDSMIDVPTNWDDGGNGRGNYCTLNPLDNAGQVLANGNLDSRRATTSWSNSGCRASFGVTSGKWYWEITQTSATSGSANNHMGVSKQAASLNNYLGSDGSGWAYEGTSGLKYTSGGGSSYGATWTTNDVIGVAFDADAGTLTFYKNGASQGQAFSGLTSGPYFPTVSLYGTISCVANFGQRPFAYTPPSGVKALNTQNLPTPTIAQGNTQFNPVLYTGDSNASTTITGVGFQPDFVWIKNRVKGNSSEGSNMLFDVVRGAQKALQANLTDAEATQSNFLTAFNADGFTPGAATRTNETGSTYVAWNWKANGAGVTNTAGSITSTVSANTTSGFSVVTYTGTGANATVGHGLGVAPSMVIVKSRTQGTTGYTGNWAVWHTAIANTEYLLLNTVDSKATGANYWNSTTPTSSVFSIGTAGLVNTNTHNFVAYCFAAIPGYSAFGSYTGNGSADGPFVYCGFRPAYVLVKMSSSTGNWVALDKSRLGYNVDNNPLYPNLAVAEGTTDLIDILSNGFKIRSTDASVNTSSGTYIFAAFAESPFKYANAR